MTPGRKPPHCKICHNPLKGHKRGVCDTTDDPPSLTAVPPSRSVSAKTQKSPPPPLPTLSADSSQILSDILRPKFHTAPPLQVPQFKRIGLRRSRRGAKDDESLREAMDAANLKVEEQRDCEKITILSKHDGLKGMPGASEKVFILLTQSHIGSLPPSNSCVVSQQLVIKASSEEFSLDPLTISISQQLKLEDPTPSGPHNPRQQLSFPDIPSAHLTIQNLLDSMARNLQHPPATIFSYPVDSITSLEESVRSHGLYMLILSLPNSKEEWLPVVIGRDNDAITKLLEDGERLAQGLRRPDKFKVYNMDLGMSHVVVGALGVLATWVGLAYT